MEGMSLFHRFESSQLSSWDPKSRGSACENLGGPIDSATGTGRES